MHEPQDLDQASEGAPKRGAVEKVESPKTIVGSLVNAIAILRHLGAVPAPLGVTAVANALGINTSSCFNILRTLVSEGLVEFDETAKTYALGLGTYDIARLALKQNQFFQLAQPRLQEVANHFSVTGVLRRVAKNERTIIIGIAEPEAPIRIQLQIAHSGPAFAGASGRCYAAIARLSRAEVKQRLQSFKSSHPVSVDDYMEGVDHVRQNGWAVVADELMTGIMAIAAPVVDDNAVMRFSVTAALFTGQHPPAVIEQIGRELRDLGEFLSHRLYGVPASEPRSPA